MRRFILDKISWLSMSFRQRKTVYNTINIINEIKFENWGSRKSQFTFSSDRLVTLHPVLSGEYDWNSGFNVIQSQIGKMGHFKKMHVISVKQKRNRKWNSPIFGDIKKICKWYHMTKSSFTCFLGHKTSRIIICFRFSSQVPRSTLSILERNWGTRSLYQ